MSLEAYIWAANLPLSVCNGTSHRVLLMLADRVDPLGYAAWPGISSMAETLECSERTIQRGIRDLLDAGLIRRGDQQHVDHLRADHRPVVYDVLTAALKYTETRGDNCVTPSKSRGDKYRPHGVTTDVAITVLEPSYQDIKRHPLLVTAQESAMTK